MSSISCAAAWDLRSRERRFPKKGTLAEAISMARNKRRMLDEEIQLDFPHLIEHVEEIVQLAQKYEAYKRERGLLDYDDLLDKLVDCSSSMARSESAFRAHIATS